MKRSDFWAVALGAAQLYLFQQLLAFLMQAGSVLPTGLTGTQPLDVIQLAILVIAFFLLFSNLGSIPRLLSLDHDKLNTVVNQVIMNSTVLLLLVFILVMLRPF